jgi:hypothetical protein
MSIQRIINVLNEKDYYEHVKRMKKIFNLANFYIKKPKELDNRRMFWIYRVLGNDAERKIPRKHLNDFQFLVMHVLKKPTENRFEDIKNHYNLKDETLQNIKFLIYPDKFPPGKYNEGLKKYDVEFYDSKIILKKLKFKDYRDLYYLMTYFPIDSKSPFIQNILDEILGLNPLLSKKSYYIKIKEIYKSLNNYEKQMINIHLKSYSYYHYKLINSNPRGIIIDGSNIIRFENNNKIKTLIDLIDNLYINEYAFFPCIIVFDKNIEYILNYEDRDILRELSNSKRVYYNSPADELIIYISNKLKYNIVSNDKFSEYEFDNNLLYEIGRFIDV